MGQEADCPEEESIAHPTYIIGQIVLIKQHTRLLGQMRGASHPDSSGGHRAPTSMLIPYILPGVVSTRGTLIASRPHIRVIDCQGRIQNNNH